MPRSTDGRWTRQCAICGQDFQQRRTDVITCSVKCRARLPHNTGGRRVKAGLEPRTCRQCGIEFQPTRQKQSFCSPECYRRSPQMAETRQRADRNRKIVDLRPRECLTCGTEFQPVREAQITCSKQCYRKSPEARAYREQYNDRRRNDPDLSAHVRIYNRTQLLKRRYGMTPAEYDAKLEAQGGVCIICGTPPDANGVRAASRLHVDHDHATGTNRDLICSNCNRGVGYFKDDPALMRAAAEYIERHRALTATPST